MAKGEVFVLAGRRDAWQENHNHIWLWAVAEVGRAGWVPEEFPLIKDGKVVAPHAYSDRELGVKRGEQTRVLKQQCGWAWCQNGQAETGWVPLNVLSAR